MGRPLLPASVDEQIRELQALITTGAKDHPRFEAWYIIQQALEIFKDNLPNWIASTFVDPREKTAKKVEEF